jgi:diacylglycerol kinase family enzyme
MTNPLTAPIPAFVNARAGSAEKAEEALAKAAAFEVRQVEPDALVEQIRKAVADGAQRILVAGGDGTIATAAAALAGTSTALAVLPGGTLNHFAKDHGIPTEPEEALELAATGPVQPTDVGYVNDRLFHGTSSLGAYIRFVRLREELESKLGYFLASIVAVVRVLATLRTYRVTLEVDGEQRTYNTPAIFIGVGERELRLPTLGGRAPDGRRGLHVIVASGGRVKQLLGVVLLALTKGIEPASRTRWLDSFVVEHCRVDPPRRGVALAVDGEVIELAAPLEYRLVRDALGVVRPEGRGLGTGDSG